MDIDVALVPNTLDAVHIGLATVIVLLTLIQILLLTFAVIGLMRRGKKTEILVARTGGEEPDPLPDTEKKTVAPSPTEQREHGRIREAQPEAALQLLGLLQNEARFIDFVEESVTAYSDAEIGAAARVVHEGCRKVLRQHFDLEPVRAEAENTRITVPKGFDSSVLRLTGNIVGQPPFSGTLVHRGWRVNQVKLPRVAEGHDASIIAAAEIEL